MRWSGETENERTARYMRGIRRFAMLPTQMDDGTWVWLESYWARLVPLHSQNFRWSRALTRSGLKEIRPTRPPSPPPSSSPAVPRERPRGTVHGK